MGRLSGKVAVVTGGSRGIGRETCRLFLREGARVVFCSRTAAEGEKVRTEIAAEGRDEDVVFVPADVTRKADVTGVVETAIDRFGGVDILVNNAQILAGWAPLAQKTDEECAAVMRSGYEATRWTMQAAFDSMRRRGGGRVINFSSFAGAIGMKYIAEYGAAKEAIGALTRSAAQEWGRYGITVNAIRPASATQENTRAIAEAVGKAFPLRRMAGPEEVARVLLGLASERGRYITGQVIHVDGGQFLMVPRMDFDANMTLPPIVTPGEVAA